MTEDDIYVDMPQKIVGTYVMVPKEKWEKIKALPEKWRISNITRYPTENDKTSKECADELEELLNK